MSVEVLVIDVLEADSPVAVLEIVVNLHVLVLELHRDHLIEVGNDGLSRTISQNVHEGRVTVDVAITVDGASAYEDLVDDVAGFGVICSHQRLELLTYDDG